MFRLPSLDLLKDQYAPEGQRQRRVSSSSREASTDRIGTDDSLLHRTKLPYSADASRNATPSTHSSNLDQEGDDSNAIPMKLSPPGAESSAAELRTLRKLKASPISGGRPGLSPLHCIDVTRSPQEGGSPAHGYRLASPILSPTATRKAQSRLKYSFAEYVEPTAPSYEHVGSHEPESLLERVPSAKPDVRHAVQVLSERTDSLPCCALQLARPFSALRTHATMSKLAKDEYDPSLSSPGLSAMELHSIRPSTVS